MPRRKRTPAAPKGLVQTPKKAKRPCKYGPRDSEGFCPKKPKSSGSRVSSKRPCKYGPRDSNGLCPKRPKKSVSSSEENGTPSWLDKPIVSTTSTGNFKKTTARKEIESVTKKVTDEATRKAVDAAVDWAKKPENRARIKSWAAEFITPKTLLAAGLSLGRLAIIPGYIATLFKVGAYADKKWQQELDARAWEKVWEVEKKLGGKALPKDVAVKLQKQHADWLRAKALEMQAALKGYSPR